MTKDKWITIEGEAFNLPRIHNEFESFDIEDITEAGWALIPVCKLGDNDDIDSDDGNCNNLEVRAERLVDRLNECDIPDGFSFSAGWHDGDYVLMYGTEVA